MEKSINLNQLIAGNVFLVLPDELHNKEDVKSKVAMFSDGTLVVSEKHKFNACCLTMELLLKRVVGDNVKKIFTTQEFIESVYVEFENVVSYESFKIGDFSVKKKSFKDILLEKAKKQAKILVKEQGISHNQALEVVAKSLLHANWKLLTEIKESDAIILLKKI